MPMYDEIIKKIAETLDKNLITAAFPKFSGEGYEAHKIDVKNFRNLNPVLSGKKIAFIDGGNAEIISSSNFSLNLIRVCCLICKNNKKITVKKLEIFAFVKAVNENDEIHYTASFFKTKDGIDLEEISFSSFDPTLMPGTNRAEVSSVANAIRRFAELRLAKSISDERLADVILLDGNLQATITNENEFLNELYDSCTKNNVVVSALSKTTSIFTDDGNSLGMVLDSISPPGPWFYHPIVEISNKNHRAEMYFVKLHKNSKHVFRLEMFNRQKSKAEETISIIAGNCTDPIFFGYPYGLVEADKIARVSNNEREALKTIFIVKLKNRNIEKYMVSKNTHQILDKISF